MILEAGMRSDDMDKTTKKITLSAMFVAIGMILPIFTGQIQIIGSMLLPMHIPVFLCGLICGCRYGLVVGAILPIMRSVISGMPPLYPVAIAMALEMATYGLVAGYLYNNWSKWQCIISLYRCMIISMIAGRIVWGIAEIILLGIKGDILTWQAFISGAFLNAIPGIILQLILIPAIMVALNKTGLVKFKKAFA